MPGEIPDDLDGQAAYWKQHYNTHKGKGAVAKYIDNWIRCVKFGSFCAKKIILENTFPIFRKFNKYKKSRIPGLIHGAPGGFALVWDNKNAPNRRGIRDGSMARGLSRLLIVERVRVQIAGYIFINKPPTIRRLIHGAPGGFALVWDNKNAPNRRGIRDGSMARGLSRLLIVERVRVQIAGYIFINKPPTIRRLIHGAPGAIRTRNPRLRRAMLYPVEPRVHIAVIITDFI